MFIPIQQAYVSGNNAGELQADQPTSLTREELRDAYGDDYEEAMASKPKSPEQEPVSLTPEAFRKVYGDGRAVTEQLGRFHDVEGNK